jgi:uncharacterized membrane protein
MSTVKTRIESIDLLRGVVMIIMALDHVRDYFHSEAFLFDPTNLSRTNGLLFFTRWITHFCAPIFVFLSGLSAYLYGLKTSKKELSVFLFTRGIWLVVLEMFVVTLGWTFNPAYPIHNLQVIWSTGISMMVLSAIIYLDRRLILLLGLLLVGAHNLLDNIHVPGDGPAAVGWSFLHEPGNFRLGNAIYMFRYPVLPWIGVITIGYYFGSLYNPATDPEIRKVTLLSLGFGAISLFLLLRGANLYGDSAHWSHQQDRILTICSFLNVTKYPPSFLYVLMTLGPAMIFLVFAERWQPFSTRPVPFRRLKALREKISVFGRVPMIYYLAHIFLIHTLAMLGAVIQGYSASDMILNARVNQSPELKGYGFNLGIVYLVWAIVIITLYPLCKYYDRYKRAHVRQQWWLSYL